MKGHVLRLDGNACKWYVTTVLFDLLASQDEAYMHPHTVALFLMGKSS